ncbi:MAG: SgcJ/EcaC family oxidoreductase [Comamonadaceae bacterium]|nr:MAG: SgcJ/EcaC family oxidoreductase [Comamonadaceae bacterium]
MLLLGACASSPGPAAAPLEVLSGTSTRIERCRTTSDAEIAALFDAWNASLQSGNPARVAAHYAPKSVLLATLANEPLVTSEQKQGYFVKFLANKPSGKIDFRQIEVGCNTAVDAGLYTFTFGSGATVAARYSYTYRWDGSRWLITTHHSSAMPQAKS